ncbi:cytochrome P450 [Wolfiporia cocos MD-104 SS10]|uniref:Cytochrome P450 n=1 Tax=Wolfiporia cocos (strain MD-104) TaxID=742152 RepID=A0A2H3JRV8_WOLCO|nr:cytochrome P450 [Wolfiporia cocos MD-104 SS10]
MELPPTVTICVLCTLLAAIYAAFKPRRGPLPPGPRGYPIIGNTLQMPREHAWVTFAQWAKDYGPIIHLSVLGSPLFVLNSPDVISELLEKRSAIYSDRPVIPMAGELIGFSEYMTLNRYGDRLRESRKLMLGALSPRSAPALNAIEEVKALELLPRLLHAPAQFRAHLRWLVASVVYQVTHGYRVESCEDPLVQSAERLNDLFGRLLEPGAFLVDSFPFLRHIPDWFPGAGFKAVAKREREALIKARDEPYDMVREQVIRGTATPSFVADLVERNSNPTPEEDNLYRSVATVFYLGGSDTSVSALESFFLIMLLYPEVQRKAQAELDCVLEPGQLPKFSDRSRLRYLSALLLEVHRWNPVVPISIPHCVTEDNVFQGYLIPKGSSVIANTWAILHNPDLYPDPFEVVPERYLKQDSPAKSEKINPDPRAFVFGYGRRACPGQMLAEDTLFIAAATILAMFDIAKALGPDGAPIEPKVQYDGGIICHPSPFDCRITPRSKEAERFMRNIAV